MKDLTVAADLSSAALSDVTEGPMRSLREQLPADVEATQPTLERFHTVKNDAGIAADMACTRRDGRLVLWRVEVWIYPTGVGTWSANVKAEIDLDDSEGEDRCVLNDQLLVTDAAAAAHAVERAAALVTRHPVEDLLTPGWEPADWGEDEDPPDTAADGPAG